VVWGYITESEPAELFDERAQAGQDIDQQRRFAVSARAASFPFQV
jgi:hypothetical protein